MGAPLQTSSTRGGRGEREGRTKLSRYTALNPATRNRFLGSCRPLQRVVEPCARVVHVRGELNVQYLLLLPGSEILDSPQALPSSPSPSGRHAGSLATRASPSGLRRHLESSPTALSASSHISVPPRPPQRRIKPHAEGMLSTRTQHRSASAQQALPGTGGLLRGTSRHSPPVRSRFVS